MSRRHVVRSTSGGFQSRVSRRAPDPMVRGEPGCATAHGRFRRGHRDASLGAGGPYPSCWQSGRRSDGNSLTCPVPYLRFSKDGHRRPMLPCIHQGIRELIFPGGTGVTSPQRRRTSMSAVTSLMRATQRRYCSLVRDRVAKKHDTLRGGLHVRPARQSRQHHLQEGRETLVLTRQSVA